MQYNIMIQYISDEGSVDEAPPPGVGGGHQELERVVRPGGLQGCQSLTKKRAKTFETVLKCTNCRVIEQLSCVFSTHVENKSYKSIPNLLITTRDPNETKVRNDQPIYY